MKFEVPSTKYETFFSLDHLNFSIVSIFEFRYSNLAEIVIMTFLLLIISFLSFPASVLAGPTSINYELKDYTFGGSGTQDSDSTNYSIFGVAGETEFGKPGSTNYKAGAGLIYTLQANVPPVPTFTNPASYYNMLKIVINTGGNPTDAKFAIAISTDNFATDTKYVQNDNTVGATLGLEDWQTYSGWGGASGINIIGLSPSTTYTVKVTAKQGNYTETGFGPTTQASTVNASLSFDIDVSSTDTETDPPFTVAIGELTPAMVITATNKVWVDVDTNGTGGASIYVYGANNGLKSTNTNYTITAVSNNLAAISEGYGARGSTVSQTSGGPMRKVAPFDGLADNVGILDSQKRIMFDSTNQPVTAGRSSFEIKAKAGAVAKAASDYADTLTVIASATF